MSDFIFENFKYLFSQNKFLKKQFSDMCQRYINYAFSIIEENPYEALEIYTLLNKFHDTLGVIPREILDLSENIVI